VLATLAALALLALAAWAWDRLQGPRLAGYIVEPQPLVQTVVATGRIVSVSRAQVGSQITGVLTERRVQEGDVVAAGEILAVLRADDLQANLRLAQAELEQLQQSTRPQAQAAVRQAKAQLAQASREAQRRRDLFARKLIAYETMEQAVQAETVARTAAEQAQLAAASLAAGNPDEAAAHERLAAAQAAFDKILIRAEVAGTVLTRDAEPGDLIQPGRVLFEIASNGDTEILVPLDEKNLEVLALGQPAQCVADAYPSQPFPAKVSFIAPRVDPQRGSVDVRLTVAPVPGFLKQDMTVSVNVETGRRERALVLPNDALAGVAGNRAQVWRVRDGIANRIDVQLGLRGLALSEITQGLDDGDAVLADADATLEDGARVRVTPRPAPASGAPENSSGETPVNFD
jgi:HlyD family secretion protein